MDNKYLIDFYKIAFLSLKQRVAGGYANLAKPTLIISIIDAIDSKAITDNKIVYNTIKPIYEDVLKSVQTEATPLKYPFYHLSSEDFWHLEWKKSTDFFVLGDAEPHMRIERTLYSSASSQSYGLNGNTITFSTIPAGNLVIDLDKQTAMVGTTDIMQYYNVNSKFLVPKTGAQKVTGTGTVKYRERWQ